MKIWFQLMASEQRSPGFISAVQQQLENCVSPSTEVLVRGTTHGAFADQYRLLFHYDEREIITNGLQAQRDGFDVYALGNSLDPGVVALREVLDIPVVVQMEVSCTVAMMTGEAFGVVATNTKSEPRYREIVHGYGLTSRLAGVDSVRFDHLPRIHEAFTNPEIAELGRRRLQGRHATPGRRGCRHRHRRRRTHDHCCPVRSARSRRRDGAGHLRTVGSIRRDRSRDPSVHRCLDQPWAAVCEAFRSGPGTCGRDVRHPAARRRHARAHGVGSGHRPPGHREYRSTRLIRAIIGEPIAGKDQRIANVREQGWIVAGEHCRRLQKASASAGDTSFRRCELETKVSCLLSG